MNSLLQMQLPGARIETSESAEAALKQIENDHYNHLISDGNLSGGSITVLKAAKSARPWLPVLMISGSWDPDVKRSARQMGALDLIEKPFDRDQFVRKVASAVGKEVGQHNGHAATDVNRSRANVRGRIITE